MSAAIATAELIAEQHEPPGAAAHLVIFVGVLVAALAVIGVNRWWKRRSREEQHSSANDPSEPNTRSRDQR